MRQIEQFYDQTANDGWMRLELHPMEFALTMRAFAEYLPLAPAALLDIGGGPGRYAIALSKQSYQVTLLDLSANNIALARQKAVEAGVILADVIHGNALDLTSIADAHYDAVLLMGPLYHLFTAAERLQAIHEAKRVLKPSGRLFAAFITRFAPLRYYASRNPHWLARNVEAAHRLLETGINEVDSFTAYFAHPTEIRPLMESVGLSTLQIIGVEGFTPRREDPVNALTGEDWDAWEALNYRLGKDPASHGAADHLLYIGSKQG